MSEPAAEASDRGRHSGFPGVNVCRRSRQLCLDVRRVGFCMHQIADHRLWIGNAGDLRDPRALLAAGIEAIVELADNEQFALLPGDLIRFRFPLFDGGANPDWLLRLVVNFVVALAKAGIPTLICCSGGLGLPIRRELAPLVGVRMEAFSTKVRGSAQAVQAQVTPAVSSAASQRGTAP